jgi:hypothetical protein
MSEYVHSKESSITTPQDRDIVNRWKPDQFVQPLTGDEMQNALKEVNNTSFTDKFPRVDRTYADPAIALQHISLFSFMPAKGATPNDAGIFGFAKIRGTFSTELEANQRAEYLIKSVDSYNQIFHTYTGRPFPITVESKYSAETTEVDIRKEMAKTVSQNIKNKKDDEYKTMQEIKEKEEALLEDTKNDEVDPYEDYITQRVKCAQLSFTYLEHQKKMAEIKEIVIKTRERIKLLDEEFPDYQNTYYQKYIDARDKAGIKESKEDTQGNFIKYLVEDAPLDF